MRFFLLPKCNYLILLCFRDFRFPTAYLENTTFPLHVWIRWWQVHTQNRLECFGDNSVIADKMCVCVLLLIDSEFSPLCGRWVMGWAVLPHSLQWTASSLSVWFLGWWCVAGGPLSGLAGPTLRGWSAGGAAGQGLDLFMQLWAVIRWRGKGKALGATVCYANITELGLVFSSPPVTGIVCKWTLLKVVTKHIPFTSSLYSLPSAWESPVPQTCF